MTPKNVCVFLFDELGFMAWALYVYDYLLLPRAINHIEEARQEDTGKPPSNKIEMKKHGMEGKKRRAREREKKRGSLAL